MSNTDALESLHTALIDTRKGYDEAITGAKTPALKTLFKEVQSLHAGAHVDVHRLLAERGVTPDESGSLMAKVHETVIEVRSALIGLDAGSLSSFARGEEHNLAKYDAAIQESGRDSAESAILKRHRGDLASMVAKMSVTADAIA